MKLNKTMRSLSHQKGFLGALASAAVPALIGGLMGGGDGGQSIQQNTQVNPFNVQGGLFGTSFDANANLNLGITDPGLAGVSQQGIAGAGQFFGQAMGSPLAAQAGEIGGQFLGGLSPDAFGTQQRLFEQQNQLLAPLQEQARLQQEGRLFSQGRLGGTSGGADQEALLRAQSAQTQGLFNQSFGQAQQQQLQQANIGSAMAQLQPGLAGMFANVGGQMLQAPLAIQQGQIDQARLGGELAGVSGTATQTGGGNPLAQGLFGAGVEGISDAIGGLFAPSAQGQIGSTERMGQQKRLAELNATFSRPGGANTFVGGF